MQELRMVFALWGVLLGTVASAQTVGPPPYQQVPNTVATAPPAYQPAYPAPQAAGPQYVAIPAGAVYPGTYPAPQAAGPQYAVVPGGVVYPQAYPAPQAAPQYAAAPAGTVYPETYPAPQVAVPQNGALPSGVGASPAFGAATYGSGMQLATPGPSTLPGNGEVQPSEEFHFADVGFRLGAFANARFGRQ